MRWMIFIGALVFVLLVFISIGFYLRSEVATGAVTTETAPENRGGSTDACVKECISSCQEDAACLEQCLYKSCGVEGPASVSIRIV